MPLSDVIRCIAGRAKRARKSGGCSAQRYGVTPHAVLFRILAREYRGPGWCAHRLARESIPKQGAAPCESIQVRRQVHGIESHAAQVIGPELVRDNEDDVWLLSRARRVRPLCAS